MDGSVTFTVFAQDYEKGVSQYSFDGGQTWQDSNVCTFSGKFVPEIAVKDVVGNVAHFNDSPSTIEIYKKNNRIYICAPLSDDNRYEYSIGNSSWLQYYDSLEIPTDRDVVVSARSATDHSLSSQKIFRNTVGSYTEYSNDMSVSYFGAVFDFSRYYDSEKGWFNSIESRIDLKNSNESIISVIMPDNTVIVFERNSNSSIFYDKTSRNILTKDKNGYIVKTDSFVFKFTPMGELDSVSDFAGKEITFDSENGRITTVTAGAGRIYRIKYDKKDNVETITNPCGEAVKYEYNDNGELIKVYWDKSTFVIATDKNINLGEYSYNSKGLLSKSRFTSIQYNEKGKVSQIKNDDGSYINYTYAYEEFALTAFSYPVPVISVTAENSLGEISNTKINEQLLPEYSSNKNGAISYSYNSNGYFLHAAMGDYWITASYDSANNITKSKIGDSTYEFTYDEDGKVLTKTTSKTAGHRNSDCTYVKYEYDENGAVSKITQSEKSDFSNPIVNIYVNCMLVQTADYSNPDMTSTVIYEYDSYGNISSEKKVYICNGESKEIVTTFTYDEIGNVISSENENGKTEYTYNAVGDTIKEFNENSSVRTIYDEYRRIVQSISAQDYDSSKDSLPNHDDYLDDNAGNRYIYNSKNQLISQTNRLNRETKYYYNSIGVKIREEFDMYKYYYSDFGQLIEKEVAGKPVTKYLYDDNRMLTSEIYLNGNVINYEYNEDSRLVAKHYNDETIPDTLYIYDDKGNLTEKQNGEVVQKYSNDSEFPTITRNNEVMLSYGGYQDNYSVNNFDNGFNVNTFDDMRQFLNSDTGDYIDYSCCLNSDKELESESYSYNWRDIIENKYETNERDGIVYKIKTVYCNEKPKTTFSSRYDENDRLIFYGCDNNDFVYTYDELNQLSRVDNSKYGYSNVYLYDENGNVLSKKSYPYSKGTLEDSKVTYEKYFEYSNAAWRDQLTAVDGERFSYDEIGNLIGYGNRELYWKRGTLLGAVSDENLACTYEYDDMGNRLSKTVNGKTTYINTQNGIFLSQSDGDNTFIALYDNFGKPFGFTYNEAQYFYITNEQGDVIGIADCGGNIIGYYTYDEWGSIIDTQMLGDNSEIMEINPLRFRGYYYDSETGYYYLQARYYDPSICRFISADDLEYVEIDKQIGTNIYLYCDNDPVNFVDYTGHFDIQKVFQEGTNDVREIVAILFPVVLILDSLTEVFTSAVQSINVDFNFNDWFSALTDVGKEMVSGAFLFATTTITTIYHNTTGFLKDFTTGIFETVYNVDVVSEIARVFSELTKRIFKSFTLNSIWVFIREYLPFAETVLDFTIIVDNYMVGNYTFT